MTSQKWAYSRNGEDEWRVCDSRDDALAEGAEDAKDADLPSFYAAPATPARPEDVCSVDALLLLERLEEDAYDSMPEDWGWFPRKIPPERVKELGAALTRVVVDWVTKHGYEPDWYDLGRAEEVKVADVPGIVP